MFPGDAQWLVHREHIMCHETEITWKCPSFFWSHILHIYSREFLLIHHYYKKKKTKILNTGDHSTSQGGRVIAPITNKTPLQEQYHFILLLEDKYLHNFGWPLQNIYKNKTRKNMWLLLSKYLQRQGFSG